MYTIIITMLVLTGAAIGGITAAYALREQRPRVVNFDEFSHVCPYFEPDSEPAGGYGCSHPEAAETVMENGADHGRCFCFACPLGTELEEDDFNGGPDAVSYWKRLDFGGITKGDFEESGYLIVYPDEKTNLALNNYDAWMERYQ